MRIRQARLKTNPVVRRDDVRGFGRENIFEPRGGEGSGKSGGQIKRPFTWDEPGPTTVWSLGSDDMSYASDPYFWIVGIPERFVVFILACITKANSHRRCLREHCMRRDRMYVVAVLPR